jgi:hypothetical protein
LLADSIALIASGPECLRPKTDKSFCFSSIYIKRKNNLFGVIDFTFDTPFALQGTIQKPSNLKVNELSKTSFSYTASYLDFIRETIKLNKICNQTNYPFDHLNLAYNIFNKCSPDKEKSEQKKKKYKLRYDLVLRFVKEQVNITGLESIKMMNTLEEILYTLENYLTSRNIRELVFSINLANYCLKQQQNEMIIGGRIYKKITRKYKNKNRRKTKRL